MDKKLLFVSDNAKYLEHVFEEHVNDRSEAKYQIECISITERYQDDRLLRLKTILSEILNKYSKFDGIYVTAATRKYDYYIDRNYFGVKIIEVLFSDSKYEALIRSVPVYLVSEEANTMSEKVIEKMNNLGVGVVFLPGDESRENLRVFDCHLRCPNGGLYNGVCQISILKCFLQNFINTVST